MTYYQYINYFIFNLKLGKFPTTPHYYINIPHYYARKKTNFNNKFIHSLIILINLGYKK